MVSKEFPFGSVGGAISFFKLQNPARQKFVDVLDPEPKSTEKVEDFTGRSSRDRWASVCHAIKRVMDASTNVEREIFSIYYLDDSLPWKAGVADIAHKMGMSTQKVYRILSRAREEFEEELIRRGLLEPPNITDEKE